MPHFRVVNASSLLVVMVLMFMLLLLGAPFGCHAVGYSYTRFVGPVRGPEQKILVHDALQGGTRVDFIAKPAYEFSYGVEDGQSRVLQNRHETRDGDAVKGVYSVVDPDGSLRVVKYTADHANGFQAEVITNGLSGVVQGQTPQYVNHAGDPHYEYTGGQYQPPQYQQQNQVQHYERGNSEDGHGANKGKRYRTKGHEEDDGEEEGEEGTAGDYEEDEYEEDGTREAQSYEESSNES